MKSAHVWITSRFSLLNLSSQTMYHIIHIFILETYHQRKSLEIQFSGLHIPNVNKTHTESPSCFSWPERPRLGLLTELHSPAMTSVCKFNMIHKNGMENTFGRSTFVIAGRHCSGSGSVTLMWSNFNIVIKVMKFQPPVVYITITTHNSFVILWVSPTLL